MQALVSATGVVSKHSTVVSLPFLPFSLNVIFHHWKTRRTLNETQKLDYLDAVKCLQSLPSKGLTRKPAETRFDDFNAAHIVLMDEIHLVVCVRSLAVVTRVNPISQGQFLPWHRWFGWLYDKALQEECGYQGAAPYVPPEPRISIRYKKTRN